MFGFIEAYPKIFTGFEIIIEFERNGNENIVQTEVNNEYKVEFEDFFSY